MALVAITGGCGYVGSHVAKAFKEKGFETLVVDRNAAKNPHTHKYVDILVEDNFFSRAFFYALDWHRPVATVHLAANSLVGPSVTNPSDYYDNNFVKTKQLVDMMISKGLNNFIFSSTSSVYGEGHEPPIYEKSEKNPLSSYGKSKYMVDMMLEDYNRAYDFNAVSFRYFNACGASEDGSLGQVKGATHLVARIMESALGQGDGLKVYGTDYPTPDGTAIRDYTHVEDIADAHVLALEFIRKNPGLHQVFNLGSGTGYSVREVISAVEKNLNTTVQYEEVDRREGDPDKVFADIQKAEALLGWKPKRNIDNIAKSAYNWYNGDVYKKLTTSSS